MYSAGCVSLLRTYHYCSFARSMLASWGALVPSSPYGDEPLLYLSSTTVCLGLLYLVSRSMLHSRRPSNQTSYQLQ